MTLLDRKETVPSSRREPFPRPGEGVLFFSEEDASLCLESPSYLSEHPSSHRITLPRHAWEERSAPLIKPSYSSHGIRDIEFDAYVALIEQVLRDLLPPTLVSALSTGEDQETIKKRLLSLNEQLPLLSSNHPEKAPCTLCISLLCHSEFDKWHWQIFMRCRVPLDRPGNFLNISSVRSLNFNFVAYPEQNLFFHQVLLDIETDNSSVSSRAIGKISKKRSA